MPFVIGWIIAAVANPLVRLLDEKLKIRRKAGSAIVIVAVIAAVIGISYWGVSLLVQQLSGFVHDLPVLWHSLEEDVSNAGRLLQRFTQYLSPDIQSQITAVIDGLTGWVSNMANQVGSHTVTVVGNYVLLSVHRTAYGGHRFFQKVCPRRLSDEMDGDVPEPDGSGRRIF